MLKNAVGTAFRWTADKLNRLGLVVAAERNSRLAVSGVRFAWRDVDFNALQGTICVNEMSSRLVRVFVHEADDVIQQHLAAGQWFDGPELETIARHYRGGTFVDIGANVGNHSLYAAIALGAPKVIAFEPVPLTFRLLQYNILLNELGGRVVAHEIGLSLADGKAAVVCSMPRNCGATQLRLDDRGTIELRRGDDLLMGEEIGFIKIDVEGGELAVLEGLGETIARHRPPMHVEVDRANRAVFERWCEATRYRITETVERETNANLLILPD